ncbi:Glycosyl transferase family 2 [Halanaeroarchaeum sp. HSR-CO]|uniref:glycosyltransferase n=1 Tax=Halanaeroarchaeum sp. HSR-CO TaxID=2866382 RepID=UPI00217DF861|nr:glycosyltransferase family 2 protein [Halanaeroarchaeum sp. HSR-CO]UWG47965.1 Glycosyl transferase family 2 [Halanaeroarchaeum sp. HSR-CO]
MTLSTADDRDEIALSVVIVTKNEADRIERCLESVIEACQQTVSRFEVVVVDSKSTDDTVEKASAYPVTVVRLTTDDVTPGAGRRVGTELVDASRILFVDGDMEIEADWLTAAISYMEGHQVAAVDGHLNETGSNRPEPVSSVRGVALYDREALESVGGFDPYLGALEDIHLGFELGVAGHRMVRLPEVAATHPDRAHLFEPLRRWRRGYSKGTGHALRRSWPSPTLLGNHLYRIRFRLTILAWLLAGVLAIRHRRTLVAWIGVAGLAFGVVVRHRGVSDSLLFFLHKTVGLLGLGLGIVDPVPPPERYPVDSVEVLSEGDSIHGVPSVMDR